MVTLSDISNYRGELIERFGKSEVLCHTNTSMSHLSIARHSGGCVINGKTFKYFEDDDMVVREDVVKWLNRRKKQEKNQESEETLLPEIES